jgi:tetratricopeptide (TPR) repeat protein
MVQEAILGPHMKQPDRFTQALRESVKTWRKVGATTALQVLDEAIAAAKEEGEGTWVKSLARLAANISKWEGDLVSERRYSEEALAYAPENAMALYGLAEALRRQGEAEMARQLAAKCYEISMRDHTEFGRATIELISKHWPEIAKPAK